MSINKELEFIKGKQYEIHVGIKDKDSYEEILTVEDFKRIIGEICTKKKMAFTLVNQHGGYAHNKGYTTETSLRVIVIGAYKDEIFALADELKKRVNTDTVLITESEIEYLFM